MRKKERRKNLPWPFVTSFITKRIIDFLTSEFASGYNADVQRQLKDFLALAHGQGRTKLKTGVW